MYGRNAISSIFLVTSLSVCAQDADRTYAVGFVYETFRIECRGVAVDPNELLIRVLPKLLDHLSNHDDLRIALDVLDYRKPNLVGYKKVNERQLVQYRNSSAGMTPFEQ